MSYGNLRFVEAYVGNKSKDGKLYFALSNQLSDHIVVHVKYCPRDCDILGRWIRVGVDRNFQSCDRVEVIEDRFPSRVVNGMAEVRVEMIENGVNRAGLQMYHSSYFGEICDGMKIIPNLVRGGRYCAWILRRREDNESTAKWKLSRNQDYNNLRILHSDNEPRNERYNGNYHRVERRSSSPDIFNEYDDESSSNQFQKNHERRENPFPFEQSRDNQRKNDVNQWINNNNNNEGNVNLSNSSSSISFGARAQKSETDNPALEKEKRRMRKKIAQLRQLVKKFTSYDEVANSMRAMNIDAFEELLKLTNKTD